MPPTRAGGSGRWKISPPASAVGACAAALARLDIRNRYRGSVLGPFWLSLSTAIMVVALGLLYSALFNLPLADYLPFLAVSLIIWGMISQIVGDACTSLTRRRASSARCRCPIRCMRCAASSAMRWSPRIACR